MGRLRTVASIYRTEEGKAEIREWCEHRLASRPDVTRTVLATSLGRTHIASFGDGSPTVIWLPGTNLNAATSLPLAASVGQRYRVHIVDLPGQPGFSEAIRLGRDRIERYRTLLEELLDALDEPVCVIAGHSLGAAVALTAAPRPSIAGLALFNPAGLVRVKLSRRLLALTFRWLYRTNYEHTVDLVEYMQHSSSAVDPSTVEWLELVARHTHPLGAPGPVPKPYQRQWIKRVVVATGDEDRLFPPGDLRKSVARNLDADLYVAPATGHLLPAENPRLVREAIDMLIQAN